MRYPFTLAIAVCLLLAFCDRISCAGTPPSKEGPPSRGVPRAAEAKDWVIGDPVQFRNLTIFPICSTIARNEDLYITLDEGLKSKKVEVFEVGAAASVPQRTHAGQQASSRPQPAESQRLVDQLHDLRPRANNRPSGNVPQQIVQGPARGEEVDGEVNRVLVLNRSDKLLYLMPGEVILGGKQDRCIGDELIIPASAKPVSIPVYCVEHGRWAGEANRGKFMASGASVNKTTRQSVQERQSQQEVWQEVGQANRRSGVSPQTGTFAANYANGKTVVQLNAYLEKLEKPVAERTQVVGVVVAINGKPDSMDMFDSTPLFLRLWPKLLKSYALDAATAAPNPDAGKFCAVSDAKTFLQDAIRGQDAGRTETRGKVAVTRHQSERVVGFSARLASEAAMEGPGNAQPSPAAKAKKSIHSSAYAK